MKPLKIVEFVVLETCPSCGMPKHIQVTTNRGVYLNEYSGFFDLVVQQIAKILPGYKDASKLARLLFENNEFREANSAEQQKMLLALAFQLLDQDGFQANTSDPADFIIQLSCLSNVLVAYKLAETAINTIFGRLANLESTQPNLN